MLVNARNLGLVCSGFQTVFNDAFAASPGYKDSVAMTVPSTGRDETHGWMGEVPALREWLGPRHVHNLATQACTITNKRFESTVSVSRADIADDRLGVFKPIFSEMGHLARDHPEELIFGLPASGFAAAGYDGQPFFDADRPVIDAAGAEVSVSDIQAGASMPWFLLDTSRAVRPRVWQERETCEFQSLTTSDGARVFMNDEQVHDVRARGNAGFGLWQLAFGSKATLDATNCAAARAAMMTFRADDGRVLGIEPTVMVLPPSLEAAALTLLDPETDDGGGSNPWKNPVELIVTPVPGGLIRWPICSPPPAISSRVPSRRIGCTCSRPGG